eukprot:503250-Prymnesium_polylepis.1
MPHARPPASRAYDTLLPTLVGAKDRPRPSCCCIPRYRCLRYYYWIRRRYRPIHHHANRRHTRACAAWQCLANRSDGMRSSVSITNNRCVRRHQYAAGYDLWLILEFWRVEAGAAAAAPLPLLHPMGDAYCSAVAC